MENGRDFYYEEISPLLTRLEISEIPDNDLWSEIWDTIHHQGDVYISSYVAVPKIFQIYTEKNWLDANLPAIFAVIENCRQKENNPKLPDWLEKDYFQTLEKAIQYCVEKSSKKWDRDFLHSFLLLVCAAKQNQGLYELLDIASSKFDEEFLLRLYNES